MEAQLEGNLDSIRTLAEQGFYNYVIVGSGFGGGILAQRLIEHRKNVLLIERGGIKFSTHCLNTSRPHWQRGSTTGPSQDNDIVYNAVKTKIQTAGGSDPYVGGPVYCLGGRASVWGLYAPEVREDIVKKYFPSSIKDYLFGKDDKGYINAFNFLTDDSQKDKVYPLGDEEYHTTIETAITKLQAAIDEYNAKYHYPSPATVEIAPMAAEFNVSQLYNFPTGAYSTVDALLDYLYAAEECLTILTNTEVLSFRTETTSKSVGSLVVRNREQLTEIPIGKETVVVLCAGALNTAKIALNSGLDTTHQLVGKGLTDHQIWGVRFAKNLKENQSTQPPMKLQANMTVCKAPALLNVCINANAFLSRSNTDLQFVDHDGSAAKPPPFFRNNPYMDLDGSNEVDTVNVTLEFAAELNNDSKVLKLPTPEPVIYVRRDNARGTEADQIEMQDLATMIRNHLLDIHISTGTSSIEQLAPRLSVAGFGVVAHEVGTMRMVPPTIESGKETVDSAVVDEDLKILGYQNLYVCDLSVFPVSPPANPSLTLTALALRLADKLGG